MLHTRRGSILRLSQEIKKSPANKSQLLGVNRGRSQSNKKNHRKSTQPDFILMRFGRLGQQSFASTEASRLVGLSCKAGIRLLS